jgi:hypothetical protein
MSSPTKLKGYISFDDFQNLKYVYQEILTNREKQLPIFHTVLVLRITGAKVVSVTISGCIVDITNRDVIKMQNVIGITSR